MIQVWIIDENGFYVETTLKNKEHITEVDITTPLRTEFLCVKPKWDFENKVWIEGATEEEIQKWIEENTVTPQPSETEILTNKINILESELLESKQTIVDLEIELLILK